MLLEPFSYLKSLTLIRIGYYGAQSLKRASRKTIIRAESSCC